MKKEHFECTLKSIKINRFMLQGKIKRKLFFKEKKECYTILTNDVPERENKKEKTIHRIFHLTRNFHGSSNFFSLLQMHLQRCF